MKWNLAIAIFFLFIWASMIFFILFPNAAPISIDTAFAISLICFPIFAIYAARYDESDVIPFCYIPKIVTSAKSSLRYDGPVLFFGRLSILGFMFLLIWAAILLAFLNAEAAANNIAIYAYYLLVLGITFIALSMWGRREIRVGDAIVERSALDLRLASIFNFLKMQKNRLRLVFPLLIRHKEERVVAKATITDERMIIQELLEYIEEIERKLEEIQQSSERQFNEIRKRLDKIEEKLNQRD